MKWSFDDDRPIYIQIVEQIKDEIASGGYGAGEKIAPVREFAQEAGVNPNTMQRALSQLEDEGYVFSNRTSGRFITEDTAALDALRTELASRAAKAYLERMDRLGFGAREAAELLLKVRKGEDISE